VIDASPSRGTTNSSAADLRERAKTANAHLEEMVLLGFRRERAAKERLERQSRPKRRAQIELVVAEETSAEPPIGRKSHAIAASAVRVRHRRNHSDCSNGAGKLVVACGAVTSRRPRNRLEIANIHQGRENFV